MKKTITSERRNELISMVNSLKELSKEELISKIFSMQLINLVDTTAADEYEEEIEKLKQQIEELKEDYDELNQAFEVLVDAYVNIGGDLNDVFEIENDNKIILN